MREHIIQIRNEGLRPKGEHAGLLLARFLAPPQERGGEAKEKDQLLKDVVGINMSSTLYRMAFARWTNDFPDGPEVRTPDYARLIVGLGQKGVLEAGLRLHHTYGVPLVPGSALKGLAAHYAHEVWGEDKRYRREAFDEVGGFDEQYFCYFEDVDLAFRLRLQGHRCLYVHSAIVRHVGSALSGYRSNFAVYHGERNAVWTFVKDMPGPLLWLYLPHHLALNVAALVYYPWRGQGRVVWRAKIDAVRGLPSVLRQRTLVQRGRRVDAWTLRRAFRHGLLAPYLARYSRQAS